MPRLLSLWNGINCVRWETYILEKFRVFSIIDPKNEITHKNEIWTIFEMFKSIFLFGEGVRIVDLWIVFKRPGLYLLFVKFSAQLIEPFEPFPRYKFSRNCRFSKKSHFFGTILSAGTWLAGTSRTTGSDVFFDNKHEPKIRLWALFMGPADETIFRQQESKYFIYSNDLMHQKLKFSLCDQINRAKS